MRSELRMRPNEPGPSPGARDRRPSNPGRQRSVVSIAAPAAPLEVAVVVPTFNERQNVTELIARRGARASRHLVGNDLRRRRLA